MQALVRLSLFEFKLSLYRYNKVYHLKFVRVPKQMSNRSRSFTANWFFIIVELGFLLK